MRYIPLGKLDETHRSACKGILPAGVPYALASSCCHISNQEVYDKINTFFSVLLQSKNMKPDIEGMHHKE